MTGVILPVHTPGTYVGRIIGIPVFPFHESSGKLDSKTFPEDMRYAESHIYERFGRELERIITACFHIRHAGLHIKTEPGILKRILALHQQDAVEGVPPILGVGRPRQELHLVHVQFVETGHITYGKVHPGSLVVHAVHDLDEAHVLGRVEPPGVDGHELHALGDHIHPFEGGQRLVEVG